MWNRLNRAAKFEDVENETFFKVIFMKNTKRRVIYHCQVTVKHHTAVLHNLKCKFSISCWWDVAVP